MPDLDLVAFRRDLHAHPETGFNLKRTANAIALELERGGLEVTRGIGGSGIVATLRRGEDAEGVALRADMDALPIEEATSLDYRSCHPGRFHGCGHDGHSTMLLGAALRLAQDPNLDQTVHFLFQPDEENGTGAAAMIADGLFDRFAISRIYGLHNMPGMPIGSFATQVGPFCAFEDNFEIRVTGLGGHASMPEKGVDPIVTGASIVTQLQTITSRSVSASDHCVVSVTDFKTDGARNILASNVFISGDCRGFEAHVSNTIERRMRAISNGICAAQGASCEVHYSTSFQPLVNDLDATAMAVRAAKEIGNIDAEYGRVGFSEDFAAFLQHRPGAFVLMGNGTHGPHAMPLHNPGYDFNDEAIDSGIAYWCALAKSG
ncbi:amidohydrolase [Phaeobacter porticola]|uniref:Putative peptidase, family M20/M25/M40 n=1 Tax=Phaeobacter porticola TaxID=1844006 RepID=A0A1L3I9Y7_9RHOB|nr:amidohydrolase [Phaeobacter porticola]APG48977.1 putative peptidase, family M20/M25/M40 [Phaeobacter porticola]